MVKVYRCCRPLAHVWPLGYLSEGRCHRLSVTELQPPSLEIR